MGLRTDFLRLRSPELLYWLHLAIHSHTASAHWLWYSSHADLGIEDVNREAAPWDAEDGGIVKESGEAPRVEGCASNQHLQLRSEASNVLDQPKQDVGVQCAFVGFIYYDDTSEEVGGVVYIFKEKNNTLILLLYYSM